MRKREPIWLTRGHRFSAEEQKRLKCSVPPHERAWKYWCFDLERQITEIISEEHFSPRRLRFWRIRFIGQFEIASRGDANKLSFVSACSLLASSSFGARTAPPAFIDQTPSAGHRENGIPSESDPNREWNFFFRRRATLSRNELSAAPN